MRHVLVVGAGGLMPPLLRQLPGGIRVSAICANRLVAKIMEPQNAPYLIGIPAEAPAATWSDLAAAVHRIEPVDHVVSFGETDQDKVPVIAERLGLRAVHSAQTLANIYDKFRMRQVLAAASLDDTFSSPVISPDDVRSFASACGYPVILKPRMATASIGVSLIAGPDDLAPAYSWVFGSDEPWNGKLVAEKFLRGSEYSVECFSEDGEHSAVAVTEKNRGSVHFVESGHLLPAPVPEETRRRLGSFVMASLTALGVRAGPTHSEVIVTESGPRMVETHVRLGGDEIPELISDAFQLDLRLLWVRQVRGERVLDEVRAALAAGPVACAGVRFVMPSAAGRLVAVSGLAQAGEIAGVADVRQLKSAGDDICAEARGSFDRCALVRAVGRDASAVIAALDDACSRLAIVLDHEAPAGELP
jgi:biotin carboxylase